MAGHTRAGEFAKPIYKIEFDKLYKQYSELLDYAHKLETRIKELEKVER